MANRTFQNSIKILRQQKNNYQALFMVVSELNQSIINGTDHVDENLVNALAESLISSRHLKQSKSFFLYREIATAIVSIIRFSSKVSIVTYSISCLKRIINISAGARLLAVAEAAGKLPLKLQAEMPEVFDIIDIPEVSYHDLLKQYHPKGDVHHKWLGRSLVSESENENLLIIKMAKQDDDLYALNMECGFMDSLSKKFATDLKFEIPKPFKSSGHYLFKIKELPVQPPGNMGIHNECIGIVFTAEPGYFIYPNERHSSFHLNEEIFSEIICRSSALFGQLSGTGMIHTAPVPLFHNRVQQDRRADGGIYDWAKGGRLDQWLESCRFPNFGESGIRDFEHFTQYDGNTSKLYKLIGSHILSLILVTGSFYRNIGRDNANKELAGKFGFDQEGQPLDVRELFNQSLLPTLLETVVRKFHAGFTGSGKYAELSFDFKKLSASLIDEMGVDRHMEEVLRIPDQKKMSEKEFSDFLNKKGYSQPEIDRMNKDEKEIIIYSGPHLGGFNQKISIPLIPELLAKIAALCILDKFDKQQA